MNSNHTVFKKYYRVPGLLFSAILLVACSLDISQGGILPTVQPTATRLLPADPEPETRPTAAPQPLPSMGFPTDLAPLSPDNAQGLTELAVIAPANPPFFHFSEDGARLAVGDLQAITIWDTASGKILNTIPAALPDCGFGFGRSFRLNADGSFIVLVNGPAIQVWQVGGGLIYSGDIISSGGINPSACGADIPELALSPDGRLLAVSGIGFSRTSAQRYFRVVDVLANSVLYEWDGSNDALHGNFYAFYGLGFSGDGSLLQTFDPIRFIRSQGNVHDAFRFWSVGDWLEVDRGSPLVKTHFQRGQLLFALSETGQVEVIDKISGKITASSPVEGCTWDFPCEARFSPDGSRAAILNQATGATSIRNGSLFKSLSIWNLDEKTADGVETSPLRDLEALLVQDDGSLIHANQINKDPLQAAAAWWVYKETFNGLQIDDSGNVSFTPRSATTADDQDCPFCSTCSFDPRQGVLNCSSGILDSEGKRISIKTEGGRFFMMQQHAGGETTIGELVLSEKIDLAKTRIRLLGYAMPQQTVFYCTDEDNRPAGCTIYDPYAKEVIASLEDISFLRFSPDGQKAAFINRKLNALFLYDLGSQTLTRKYPYQARAYPVNAVFSNDGTTFFYVIQNLDNAYDLSVEALDAQSAKSFGRVSLRKADISKPTAFSVSNDGRLWFFTNEDGLVSILSADKGSLPHQWRAHGDGILGLAVDPGQQWLVSMGRNGILKFWGVR